MATFLIILLSFISVKIGITVEPIVLVKQNNGGANALEYNFPRCARLENGSLKYAAKNSQTKPEYFCPLPQRSSEDCLIQNSPEQMQCEHEVIPNIQLLRQSCTTKENRKLYGFGYRFCPRNGKFRMSPFQKNIYRFCYDTDKQEVVYVDYKIISPYLLDEKELERNQEYSSKIKGEDYDITDFQKFEKLIKGHKEAILERPALEKRLVIPSSHMALALWKKPLYHQVNVKLMRKKIGEFLDYVDNYLRDVSIELGEIRVKTGTFNLWPRDSYIWWKLVYDETEEYAIAIIIHNENEAPAEDAKICKINICDQNDWKYMILNNAAEFIYCCDPNELTNFFGFPNTRVWNLKLNQPNEKSSTDETCVW